MAELLSASRFADCLVLEERAFFDCVEGVFDEAEAADNLPVGTCEGFDCTAVDGVLALDVTKAKAFDGCKVIGFVEAYDGVCIGVLGTVDNGNTDLGTGYAGP